MGKRDFLEEQRLKKLVYLFSFTLIISIIVFITLFTAYNRSLKEDSKNALTELGKMNNIVSNEDLKEASFSTDLSVADTTNNISNATAQNSSVNKKDKKVVNKTPVQATVDNTNTTNSTIDSINVVTNEISESKEEEKKELNFIAPVSGEIIKDFVQDTLVYSNTLKEWTTHTGIDIKADKTSIVVASENGRIENIKNDPRYGLTVIIKHDDGFKTVYSNLLTTEFVKEGETVEKGQTIATIGESASFEIADESHLHFEMYKDDECVNPTIYLKDI